MKCKEKYRDKEKFRRYRERSKKKYYEKRGTHKFKPSKYTQKEDELILKHEIPDTELSEKIQHSVKSIHTRRWILKQKRER